MQEDIIIGGMMQKDIIEGRDDVEGMDIRGGHYRRDDVQRRTI